MFVLFVFLQTEHFPGSPDNEDLPSASLVIDIMPSVDNSPDDTPNIGLSVTVSC